MREMLATCHQCKQPLVVIDNRRLHLVSCLICSPWPISKQAKNDADNHHKSERE